MKEKTWLSSHTPQITAGLFLIQPVMDVLSYWLQEWGVSNLPTLLLRFGVLGLTMLFGFILSERKRVYYIAAAVIAFIGLGHVGACLQVGYTAPISDLTNYIRVVQMPITVLCLITFLRQDDRSFEGMQLGLTGALFLTLAVEIISVITGTDPGTYTDGTGIIGWFHNTNSQSSNLCVLVPISLAWQLSRKKRNWILFWITAVLGCFSMYFFATRLAYLGIAVVTAGMALSILLARRSDWKVALGFLALFALFALLMPRSPMMIHLNATSGKQDERQGYINEQLGENLSEVQTLIQKAPNKPKPTHTTPGTTEETEAPEEESGLTESERERLIQELTPVYQHYVKDFVQIFGTEKTIEMFNYTINVREFASVREKKLLFAQMLMEDSPLSARFFGINLARFSVGNNIYDVENDLHGIYYLYGGVGLAAYLLFLAYFVYLIIWALCKNAKRYFTVEAASYGIAFLLCMAHVYNTAGVLRRPNASIYLSAILAGIYYLVRIRRYPDQTAPTTLQHAKQ